jgi:pimeloyl-ACP methyl ester carboxylesterase
VPRHRLLAGLRRAGIGVLALAVLITGFSLVFNRLTDGRRTRPGGLRYVQAGDVPTRVRSWGAGGTPVMLVHGAAESADTWADVADRLATDHRVYALDLDGWGYSTRVAPFDLSHQADQLLATLKALGLAHTLLVGHSSGAAVVAEAALRSPGLVSGVLLLDGDALVTGAGEKSPVRHLVLPPYRTTLLRLALRSDALIRSIFGRQCGPACTALDAAGVDAWRRPLQVPGAEAGLWGMLDAGVPGLTTTRLAGLARLSMPKAVVFGAQDDVFSPQAPRQTADRIGAPAPTLLPGGHHLTMISNPDPVAGSIKVLAARASRAPGSGV